MQKNLILLHGWGASADKLKHLEIELNKSGWITQNMKLPGFDLTYPKFAWWLKDYSDYVSKEAEKVFRGNKYYIFGHSFGGRIAIKLASYAPDKLTGVVLCSTAGISRGRSVKRVIFLILAKIGKILLIAPTLARFWRKIIYKLAKEHDYEKASGIMKKVFKKVISEDVRELLAKIKVPTLILWGEEDKMTPVNDAYFLNEKIRDSKLVIFKNQGHKLPYIGTKEVAKEIDKWVNSQI